jgi:hypothetical protein
MFLTLILSILSLTQIQRDRLHFQADLEHDKRILAGHGSIIDDDTRHHLKIFDAYSTMRFNFASKKIVDNYHITKWKEQKSNQIIYQVDCRILADTSTTIYDIGNGQKEVIPLKKEVYVAFRIYVMKNETHGILTYTTHVKDRMVGFTIASKMFSPIYEDIMLGVNYPDEKKLITIINEF